MRLKPSIVQTLKSPLLNTINCKFQICRAEVQLQAITFFSVLVVPKKQNPHSLSYRTSTQWDEPLLTPSSGSIVDSWPSARCLQLNHSSRISAPVCFPIIDLNLRSRHLCRVASHQDFSLQPAGWATSRGFRTFTPAAAEVSSLFFFF